MGGEEFCILMPDTSLEGAWMLPKNCDKPLRHAFDKNINVTASFGVW